MDQAAPSMTSLTLRTLVTLGLLFNLLCLIVWPVFSGAAVIGPVIGAVAALLAKAGRLGRTALLATVTAVATAVQLVLLSLRLESSVGFFGALILVALLSVILLASYIYSRRRTARSP